MSTDATRCLRAGSAHKAHWHPYTPSSGFRIIRRARTLCVSATTLPSAAILQIPPFLRGDSEARAWAWLLQRIGVTEDRVPRGAASAQSSPRPSKFPHSDADVDPQRYTRRVHSRRCDDWPIDSGVKLVRVWNKQAAGAYIERCATPSSPQPTLPSLNHLLLSSPPLKCPLSLLLSCWPSRMSLHLSLACSPVPSVFVSSYCTLWRDRRLFQAALQEVSLLSPPAPVVR